MYSKGLAVGSCLELQRFSPQSLSLSLKISFDTVLNPVTLKSCAALQNNYVLPTITFPRKEIRLKMVHFSVD